MSKVLTDAWCGGRATMNQMPTWEEFMVPTLRVMADGEIRHRRDLCPLVAEYVGLTAEQRSVTLPSGQLLYENRIGWGLSFLAIVGGLERPSRGRYVMTEGGRYLLDRFPDGMREGDVNAVAEDPSTPIRPYEPTTRSATKEVPTAPAEAVSMTPTEQVQSGVSRIHEDVAEELLARLQGKDAGFFEDAVVKLLLAMGYGGTGGRGSVTQLSNDGGIDGVIDQDVLGLSKVYIQAKRYAGHNVVQRPDVQGFVGALAGKADRGVFITTSRFSEGAKTYAEAVPTRIILIDGARLTDLMIRYGIGVQVRETVSIVEIDEDFFS
ncbi:mrr restriction system protein [Demequina sediminis]|uniref:Mrr restriction system protein n=1 Tax=Demequina sediminis TaxID=1930058 RepID=A0ABP9WIG6_9MICO|nr:restriction endonuclease [Demequina sediminis]BDZ61551.1 restriction endonuclease [Demequina sediminis]